MSNATMQATIKVDKNCAKECPSSYIHVQLSSHKCTQSVVTPSNPATPSLDQVVSASTYAGCPFNSCCYSDSDIKWSFYYLDGTGNEVAVGSIKFHEPNSGSWHNDGPTSEDPYDVSVTMISDVTRNSKFNVAIRAAPSDGLIEKHPGG